MNILKISTILLAIIYCVGCAEVEDSAGKALDNANSVIKDSREKLWSPPEATVTPTATPKNMY